MALVSRLNDPSLAASIRYFITCGQGHHKFKFIRNDHNYNVKVERAPEPEDIIWTNLAVPLEEKVKKKLATFSVTFVTLGISFAIVYGLSQAQKSYKENNALSFVISIMISLISKILDSILLSNLVIIKKLSILERDFTVTKYQTSLAVKSIFAQLFNTILIPVFVNFYIKDDIYGQNGLASDVFMLGVTNSFLTPILKLVNIGFIINRIIKYFLSRPSNST